MRTARKHPTRGITRVMVTVMACLAAGMGATQEAEQPDRYAVELIVFRHVDQSRNTPETNAPRRLVFSDLPSEPDAPQNSIEPGGNYGNDPINVRNAFTPLTRDQLKLTDTYQRLSQLDAYAPILHTGWSQEARSTDEALPNRLTSTRNGRSPLSGSVTLYKQRFLHLNIDLALSETTANDPVNSFVFSDRPQLPDANATRLQESRRIRNEDVNYFDHPRIGVIVTVREIEVSDAETTIDTDS